jgi:hypothetical protein
MPPPEFEPRKREAIDPRLRPLGHWDRPWFKMGKAASLCLLGMKRDRLCVLSLENGIGGANEKRLKSIIRAKRRIFNANADSYIFSILHFLERCVCGDSLLLGYDHSSLSSRIYRMWQLSFRIVTSTPVKRTL